MKAEKLFKKAYFSISKNAANQPLTTDKSEAAVDALNDLMYEYADLGLGYTIITSDGDDITTPNWSWRWMRYLLALELAEEFGTLANYNTLEAKRREAYSSVLAATIDIPPPELTSNVPKGSGNTGFDDVWSRDYYTETDEGVLTEQNDIIVTED